ncbi:YveK family protein [Fundicoccus culcitae]|uniref:Capsular polysaccharide biosynthesis protein CpsC n=1 Tax=Fundicoccus culcitae TaxID=2969821 RepID=A0ABY5P936_9LACT|nr:Wzz/FepE/Etk N-terminal domain-containing protein [Fundicoccus culcitae]UUX35259.1 Wzz/FepE/Etk N-terminal domain-containing protein [Fundicoccus culcitae]
MEELNAWELLNRFRKYIFSILVFAILGAIVFAVGVNVLVEKEYQSESQLLVNQRTTQEDVQVGDIQTNVMLVNTYRDIFLADSVLMTVSERLDNQFSVAELKDSIRVDQSENSQAFYLTVTTNSPNTAQAVNDTLIDVFIEMVNEVYEGELSGIYVLSPATYNPNAVSPSVPRFAFVGFVVGAFIGIIIALIRELSDTTVKDDEIFIRMGLNKLGEVYELSSKDITSARRKMGTDNKKRTEADNQVQVREETRLSRLHGVKEEPNTVENKEEVTNLRRNKV